MPHLTGGDLLSILYACFVDVRAAIRRLQNGAIGLIIGRPPIVSLWILNGH
jgi:hypothetical protein